MATTDVETRLIKINDFLRTNGYGSTARRGLFLMLFAATLGCTAQSTPAKTPAATATPAAATAAAAQQTSLDRRIEMKIRSAFHVPAEYTVSIGKRGKSDISGYDSLPVTFSQGSHQKITNFLISTDNNTLARMEKFDLSRSPLSGVSLTGRPVRGSEHALVTIVNFDDLECPYCGKMHAELFPATMEHYKDQVRFIYTDDPLVEIHPWALHAAIDADCLASQSPVGYWNLVDYIHAHGDDISGDRNHPDLPATMLKLDQLTEAEGKRQNVNADHLASCIGKQDDKEVRASMKEGASLGIDATPTIFINGEQLTGLVPQQVLWATIDRAIVDAGGTPPPGGATTSTGPSAPVK